MGQSLKMKPSGNFFGRFYFTFFRVERIMVVRMGATLIASEGAA